VITALAKQCKMIETLLHSVCNEMLDLATGCCDTELATRSIHSQNERRTLEVRFSLGVAHTTH